MTGPEIKYYAFAAAGVAGPGTVAIAGSTGVLGTGTSFGNYNPGDTIVINGEEHTVGAVASALSLATVNPWAQTVSGAAYTYYSLQQTLFSAFGIPFPKGVYEPYSQPLDLGDGSLRGGGWPTAEWRWGYLTRAQRQSLRGYLPITVPAIGQPSGLVRLCTSVNEQNDVFVTFKGQMLWPHPEARDYQRRPGFVLRFRALVDLS
jgi:hypothetical protein